MDNKDTKYSGIDVTVRYTYKGMIVTMTNIKSKESDEILYQVSNWQDATWIRVHGEAEKFILDGFKQTELHERGFSAICAAIDEMKEEVQTIPKN